jgi:hypothetical protein
MTEQDVAVETEWQTIDGGKENEVWMEDANLPIPVCTVVSILSGVFP